jgi:hypothetical protein
MIVHYAMKHIFAFIMWQIFLLEGAEVLFAVTNMWGIQNVNAVFV